MEHTDKDRPELSKYRRKGSLTRRKLLEFIPTMTVTHLSLLLINTVDKVVAGNFIGPEAINSISIFYPLLLLTSTFSTVTAVGISTNLSGAMGSNDAKGLAHIKGAGVQVMVLSAIAAGIIQIPIVWGIILSYGVSGELSSMIWQYAIGYMICTPLSLVSSVGTLQLQIAGRMRVIMALTLAEGGFNLVFDLLFVAGFHMGVAGAGFGTACSNLIRCTATVIYIAKNTDFYKGDGQRLSLRDVRTILASGVPEASFSLMVAFQNYCILRIILYSLGDAGGVIYGVCIFCLNLVNVLLIGIQSGVRPLMGLFSGAGDKQGLRELMRQGFLCVLVCAGITSAFIIFFPASFYYFHGVREIPAGGLLAVQLYAIPFVLRGFDYLLRLYFSNRKDLRFATILTVVGNGTLPLFALVIALANVAAPFIFLAYTFTELLVFGLSAKRYIYWSALDRKEDTEDVVLYMTVRQEDAVEASQHIRQFAEEHGIDHRISYRAALCMEEMVSYIQQAETAASPSARTKKAVSAILGAEVSFPPHSESISVDVLLRFESSHSAVFITLDDGAFIALDQDEETHQLITDNYSLIKKVAISVEYQYILNMNYTKITLQ